MSSFLFNCCNNQDHTNYSQATISSISRNINNKSNKPKNIPVPKSSLKTLTAIKSLKSFENGSRSTLTYVPPSVYRSPDILARNLGPTPISSSDRILYTPQRSQVFLNPTLQEVTPALLQTAAKIKFSYSAEKRSQAEESILSPKNPNLFKQNQKNFRSSKYSKKQQQTQPQPPTIPPTQPQKSQSQPQPQQKSKPDKIKLGGSKYTVLSQQQVQQVLIDETSMKLDQSQIIINVFNPTKSQLEQWSKDPNPEDKRRG